MSNSPLTFPCIKSCSFYYHQLIRTLNIYHLAKKLKINGDCVDNSGSSVTNYKI